MDKTVVVPVEPTKEMIEATWALNGEKFTVEAIYKAMIAAAPAPAAQDEREAFEIYWAGVLLIHPEYHQFPDMKAGQWQGWQARAALTALTAPQDAQERNAKLVVSTAAGCDALAVVVSLVRGDHTLVLYTKNHTLNGDSMGIADVPAWPNTAQPADKPEGKTEQQAEPVAYVLKTGHGTGIRLRISSLDPEVQKMWQPIYAHPPAQPQQLTDEEIDYFRRNYEKFDSEGRERFDYTGFARAIERALLAAGKERT